MRLKHWLVTRTMVKEPPSKVRSTIWTTLVHKLFELKRRFHCSCTWQLIIIFERILRKQNVPFERVKRCWEQHAFLGIRATYRESLNFTLNLLPIQLSIWRNVAEYGSIINRNIAFENNCSSYNSLRVLHTCTGIYRQRRRLLIPLTSEQKLWARTPRPIFPIAAHYMLTKFNETTGPYLYSPRSPIPSKYHYVYRTSQKLATRFLSNSFHNSVTDYFTKQHFFRGFRAIPMPLRLLKLVHFHRALRLSLSIALFKHFSPLVFHIPQRSFLSCYTSLNFIFYRKPIPFRVWRFTHF